jgi:hypothetical protein
MLGCRIALCFFLITFLPVPAFCVTSENIEIAKRSVFGESGKTLETLVKQHPEVIRSSVRWTVDTIPIEIINLDFDYRPEKGLFNFKKQKISHLQVSFTVYEGKASFLAVERNKQWSATSDFNYREFMRALEKKTAFDEMLLLPPERPDDIRRDQLPVIPEGK